MRDGWIHGSNNVSQLSRQLIGFYESSADMIQEIVHLFQCLCCPAILHVHGRGYLLDHVHQLNQKLEKSQSVNQHQIPPY